MQQTGRQHQAVLHRAIYTLVALLDDTPIVACEHIEVVAQEGDIDLFLWEALPGGNRLRDKLRRGLALHECCGIGEDVVHKGGGTEVERERHMRAVLNGLAESPVGEQAARAVVFADEGGDMHLPVLKQALDHLLKKIRPPLRHRHQQHEQQAQPFDILRVANRGSKP